MARYDYDAGMRGRERSGRDLSRAPYDSGFRGERGFHGDAGLRGESGFHADGGFRGEGGLRGDTGFRGEGGDPARRPYGEQGGSWGLEWVPRPGGLPDPYDAGMRGRGSPNANVHGGLSAGNRDRGYDRGMRGYDRGFERGRWTGSSPERNDLGHARPSEFQYGRGPASPGWQPRQRQWPPYAGPRSFGAGSGDAGRGYGQDYRAQSGYDRDVRGRRWF
ncbi:MAG TPA: hypothetical protein VFH27_00100 [Longimicrobiaceae bacterium]|nr:hypothetical protein [Longimicrobiaceae bacterium]